MHWARNEELSLGLNAAPDINRINLSTLGEKTSGGHDLLAGGTKNGHPVLSSCCRKPVDDSVEDTEHRHQTMTVRVPFPRTKD